MTSHCQHCCHENESGSSSSSFVFGIILGAVIGAIVAILIYRNNKGQVFEQLKENLQKYFQGFMGGQTQPEETEIKKKSKPKIKEVIEIVQNPKTESKPAPKKPAPKMFVKPKK